jgi:hypothetical protein
MLLTGSNIFLTFAWDSKLACPSAGGAAENRQRKFLSPHPGLYLFVH